MARPVSQRPQLGHVREPALQPAGAHRARPDLPRHDRRRPPANLRDRRPERRPVACLLPRRRRLLRASRGGQVRHPPGDEGPGAVSDGAKKSKRSDSRGRVLDELRVEPGKKANLSRRSTSWTGGEEFEKLSPKKLDAAAKKLLAEGIDRLKDAQELLWASDTYSLLVVFQAMDAAGKDSTIEHVMSGVNPQGVQVVSFKQPSTEELDHTYLWRVAKNAPERGRIGIFNRSHYEEVVALRVHREWLEA